MECRETLSIAEPARSGGLQTAERIQLAPGTAKETAVWKAPLLGTRSTNQPVFETPRPSPRSV
jgi:hypothetical protein